MNSARLTAAWAATAILTACLAPRLAAESFALTSGQSAVGDVVWVKTGSLELMELGSTKVRSIPLAQLDAASRYRAQLHRRALTGSPGYLELARLARGWGLLGEAQDELWNAAKLRGNEAAIESELTALGEAVASRRLADARAAIARGQFASAGSLLERVGSSGTSSAATAKQLSQQHSAQITQARTAAAVQQAERQAKRAERRLRKAREAAEKALFAAELIIAEADAIRIEGIQDSWPISRTKWGMLDAAAGYVRAGNLAAGAGHELPADDELHERAAALYDSAHAKLVDCYCDIADAYVIRGNLIDAHEWASVALVIDPEAERALKIRNAARLGGAIRGGGGGWGRRRGYRGYGPAYGHGGEYGPDPTGDMGDITGNTVGWTRGANGDDYGAPGYSDPGVTTRTRGAAYAEPPATAPGSGMGSGGRGGRRGGGGGSPGRYTPPAPR